MFRIISFVGFVFFLQQAAFGNVLSGRMVSSGGEPIPYGAVYVKGTTNGTTTNEQGFYTLDLSPGVYTVIYQAMGYIQKQLEIDLLAGNKTLDITLTASSITLPEAIISNGEDPAYGIIRQSIKKRKYFLEQVNAYSCDVYIKGLQRVTEHPEKIMGLEVDPDGEIDSVSGIVYLSESVSKYNFQRPDKVKEEMISSKVSGDNQAFSYNRASDMMFNFYQNLIEIEELSERGFVSPIAGNAMLFYKYRLAGTFFENDSMINKIEVIPRRTSDPCFRGYIYIMENSWRIHSTELYLTKDAQIDFVDTLMINQTFVPVEKDIWMVFMNRFTFVFGFMGVKGDGIYIGVNSNFVIDPDFPKKFFDNEEMHVNDDANQRDSAYWEETRPVPLTIEEQNDYHRRDSIARIRNSKEYLDSLDKRGNQPGIVDIVFTGYTFNRRYNHFALTVSPLITSVSFNTVQGIRAATDVSVYKSWQNNKYFTVSPGFSYGVSDRRFYSDFESTYYYKPVRFARVTVAGGATTAQFNSREPIGVFFNSAYTLLLKQNYLKIYSKSYGSAAWFGEIANGFVLLAHMEFAERSPLYNSAKFYWIENNERHFTSNDPQNPGDENSGFTRHRALTINFQATVRFKQKYYTRPNEKIILGSKYPTFGFQWRRGIPGIFGSSTNYDFVKFSIRDQLDLKLLGKFNYYFGMGKFLSKKNLPFIDFYHFMGNQMIWSQFTAQSYQLLDYYAFSTGDWYLEGHGEHHFGGFILNKIPIVKRLKLTEVAGVNWLMTQDVPSYYEIYFGVDKLGVVRVDFAMGYMQNAKVSAGLRVGIRL
jgi:hypothetical protein